MSITEPSNFKDPKSYTPGEVLITTAQIDVRLKELVQEIAARYKGQELLVVGLMKGGLMVTADLTRELYDAGLTDMSISLMTIKSYTDGTTATHQPTIIQDIDVDPKGRHVLIVDDIADTRKSLQLVYDRMIRGQAASVASFVLLDKPKRKEVNFNLDYVGFSIPNIWVQGMGMDTRERGRSDRRVIVGPYTP